MPKQSAITSEQLRSKLKLKHLESKRKLIQKHPKAHDFLSEKGIDLSQIRQHSAKLLGTGAIAGMLLISQPDVKLLPTVNDLMSKISNQTNDSQKDSQSSSGLLAKSLQSVLPEKPRPLVRSEEKLLEQIFVSTLHLNAKATLEGEHLNTTYGYIGLEQHLRRYPGDVISEHGEGKILYQGMAPGLGAWGYFANSKEKMTPDLVEKEKWYAVVQTLYLPDWNTRQPYLKNWYKHRKVLIVNTENGNSVVASIADSGPAAWTGKHYGGSPEVMNYLGGERYTKGKVIVFFVDDPENKISLGPIIEKDANLILEGN